MRLLYTFYQRSSWLLVLFFLSGLGSYAQNGGVTSTQSFTYTGRIETFTVPAGVTSLTIEARGAEGGYGAPIFGGGDGLKTAGKGALIRGTVSSSGGQVLKILVGQKSPNRNGGGGGSFVTTTDNTPLIIAGGGGGSGGDQDVATKDGQTGRTGGANGGSNGQGGPAINGGAAGGGGLLTDGVSSTVNGNGETSQGGKAFVSGGAGSSNNDSFGLGGFGGGGSGTGVGAGGGGGGYSGGGGGGGGPGGGGASYYESATLLSAIAGVNTGNGQVLITYAVPPCPPVTITRQPASASTVCAGGPISTFVTADGSQTTYQWYRGTALLSNQTSATLTLPSAQASDAGSYSVVVSSRCTSVTSTAFSLTVNPIPPTPTLLTKQGQRYPGGQSSVTVDVNSPSVVLEVGGCNGTINWTGSNGSAGNTDIIVPTNGVGQVVYQAICTVNGCPSAPASATVTIQAQLTVLHRDVDNYADNNAVQPLLQIQNRGTAPLPYSALTLRYYLTVEGDSPLSNLFVNDAQVGSGNVRLRYVSLVPVRTGADATSLPSARQGATGYVEVSFTPAAGSLAPGANSGNLRLYFAKSDYSALNELDDYSYAQVRDQLVNNPRITAYYNGALVAGTEPGEVAANLAVQALTESKNGASANQINTYLVIRNTGNVAIPYSSLRARYYFTSDNNQTARVELDEGEAQVRVIKLPAPVGGADSYVEVRYTREGLLMPGSSTGRVRYRIMRSDDGRFDQTNDYSYQERPEALSPNNRVTVLVFNRLTWGTPPAGAPARIGVSQEPGNDLKVSVLGNPLRGELVRVQINGAGAGPLQLQLVNAQGRVINTRQIATPQATEQQELSVAGQGPGVLLLQVSTPTQRQTIRVLKAE